jgi:menaquinone-9 beta-reductase
MRTAARDIVIVGGGPAGLVTALSAIARTPSLAARIVVLEGERYPRDKYCAGAVGGRGERLLSALGALPDVARVTLRAASLETGRGIREVRPDQPIGSVVRRLEHDAALARLASRRGVHIEQGVRVRELVREPDGVRVVTSEGELRAAFAVGADGVGSVVRRGAFPLPQARAQVLEIDTERVPQDGPADAVHFDLADPSFAGYFWDFPTPIEGRIHASRGVYVVKAPGDTVDLDALLDARLRRMGLRLSDHPKKRYGERGFPLEGSLSDARTMLVGEAAGIDPVTGEGIAQAIEYGVLAGDFLASGRPLPAWTSALRRSRLGRDLRVRTLALRPFYGAARVRALRLLEERPELLEAAARHFGGLPQRTGALALGALHVAKAAAAHRFLRSDRRPEGP